MNIFLVYLFISVVGVLSLPTKDPLPSDPEAPEPSMVHESLTRVINAIGGLDTLEKIKTFEYQANDIYRSATLTQTYNLYSLDQSVASAGSQKMSFEKSGSGLKSRIDRAYAYNEYWTWAFPDLSPAVNLSVVVHDTDEPYACFIQGQNNFFSPNLSSAQGYADGLLTDYLIHQSHQFALPWLLQRFLSNNSTLQSYVVRDPTTMAYHTAIEHVQLGLSLLYDQNTHLPYAIRSREQHSLYGPSNSDVVLTSYSNVSVEVGLQMLLPHRLQTVYNSQFVLEDFLIDRITINPSFPGSLFEGHAPTPSAEDLSQTAGTVAVRPQRSNKFPRSEVHEFYETGLWGGPFDTLFNASDVVVDYPYPAFKNIMRVYVGYPDYVQLLVEHANGFIITDAPAHRSELILKWLRQNKPGKRITHVVPSHHHRDHAGGVNDYIDSGAILVVPEIARNFYNQSGKQITTETYTAERPFVYKDNGIEFRSYWKANNPHAEDWSFAVATRAHANDDDPFVLFNADVVNPGSEALRWDVGAARSFLIEAMKAGVPQSTLLIGAHGSTEDGTSQELTTIADIIGFEYPALRSKDWHAGCESLR